MPCYVLRYERYDVKSKENRSILGRKATGLYYNSLPEYKVNEHTSYYGSWEGLVLKSFAIVLVSTKSEGNSGKVWRKIWRQRA
jgi:hypothetical protein